MAGSRHQEYVGSVSTGVGDELTYFVDRLVVVDWSHIIVQNIFVVCFDERNLHRVEIQNTIIRRLTYYLVLYMLFLKNHALDWMDVKKNSCYMYICRQIGKHHGTSFSRCVLFEI